MNGGDVSELRETKFKNKSLSTEITDLNETVNMLRGEIKTMTELRGLSFWISATFGACL